MQSVRRSAESAREAEEILLYVSMCEVRASTQHVRVCAAMNYGFRIHPQEGGDCARDVCLFIPFCNTLHIVA